MKQVDHTEWELLKRHAADHLQSKLWLSGTFCVSPNQARATEVWVPQISASPIHIVR